MRLTRERTVRTTEQADINARFYLTNSGDVVSLHVEYDNPAGTRIAQTLADITPEGIKLTDWVAANLPLPRQGGPTSAIRVVR